ncbi:hypothetical protein N9R04_09085 [Staphylococcus sp. SQ8-PEA]|uniref:NERD domain-containing protein n=1 Tax=Staphylococcus marylandisciuri TaxID=2981529 RepID=A0ABT2QS97_9STAP|nr:hypothetical protein [Staphylococcus marylandisciuri]MCU5746828.1 hypothetical protein [Staphylococcus marylandisciuri]
MSALVPIEVGLIVAVIIAVICFILFLVALASKKKVQNKIQSQYETREQQLSDKHKDELEKERIENKKTVTKQNEEHQATVNSKDREIDALKLFSKNHSEYVTDMRLIGIRERLVNEKRIRPEDMHIMANIFLPRNEFDDVKRISHLVLTRTGLYIIDSQLLKGHVLSGVSAMQFKEQPLLEQVFDTLDISKDVPHTLVFDKNKDNKSLSIIDYTEHLKDIEKLARDIQTKLNLKFTPTTILYFNPKRAGDVTISNYAQTSNSKVLVGPEQLNEYFNKFVFHGRIQYDVKELQRIMEEIETFN